ncbi:MAG TPA: TMEM175 family protein [Sphingomicrobium sp.]|nr:TMEM175 family protein [Sphingomicrobium sp.]
MNKNRVELFSDGVFAIVLTLLVLNLKVPASHGLAALRDITPALIVHAATFFLVGVMWVGHHGALARVDKITHRALLFNLLILFWVTLLPFGAENAADRPLEPLGPSLLAFSCGAFFLSYLGFRFSVHSTIDDLPEMRRWKRTRVAIAIAMVIGTFACSALAWISPWIGYGGALATVLVFLLLRSPPESEEKYILEAKAQKMPEA